MTPRVRLGVWLVVQLWPLMPRRARVWAFLADELQDLPRPAPRWPVYARELGRLLLCLLVAAAWALTLALWVP